MRLHALVRGLLRAIPAAAIPLMAAVSRAPAQEPVTVTGRVSGERQPLRGASVRIPELDIGATTDANGRYSLIIPSSRVRGQTVTLTARASRFVTQSIPITLVGGALTQNFELVSTRGVVTDPGGGLPSSPRDTNAASSDRADSAALSAAFDLTAGLIGRVAGLRISSSASRGGSALLLSRGFRSLSGFNNGLVVVDGIPLEGTNFTHASQRFGFGGFDYGSSVQDLNPSDILSVRLLQGADAAVLYGGRAANGVLEISSRNGRGLNSIEITAAHRLTFDSPLRLPSFQNSFGQGSGGEFFFFDGQGAGINDDVPDSWGPALNGQPIPQASYTEPRLGDVRYWLPRPNNVTGYFADTRSNITDASVAGGNQRGDFRISLRGVSAPTLAAEGSVTRRSASARGAHRFSDRLRAALAASFVSTSFDNIGGSGFDEANPMAALVRLPRQIDVDSLRSHVRDTADNQITWIYTGARNNPWFAPLENDNHASRGHLTLGGSVDFSLTPWLTATGTASTDRIAEERSVSIAPGWLGGVSTEIGRLAFSEGGYQSQDIEARANSLGLVLSAHPAARGNWRPAVSAGANLRTNATEQFSVVYDTAAVGSDPADVARWLEGRREAGEARTLGLFVTSSLSYGQLASVTVAAHRESADYLPAANEANLYPSVLGELDLREMITALRGSTSAARLRASWARTSSDVTPYMIRSMYRGAQSSDSMSLDTLSAVQRGTSLRPERTAIAQAGLDLGLFAQRMSVGFTMYTERTTDLILPGASSTSGVVEAMNAGAITNRGIQAAVSAVPVSRGRFAWTATATVTRNANRVESLGDTTSRVAIGPARWGVSLEARPGQPLGAIVGSRLSRHDVTGELVLEDGHPVPAADSGVLGHTEPKLFGGVSNTFRYRNVELSFLFDGQFGGKLFSATNMWGAFSGTLAETGFRPDTGLLIQGFDLATGSANTVHVSAEDYYRALGRIAEPWVYDASFVKLRELRIGATFRVPAVSVFRNSRVEASLIGRNLAMWSKAPNIDPETVFSTSAYQGFDLAQVPRPRSFGFQLTVVP